MSKRVNQEAQNTQVESKKEEDLLLNTAQVAMNSGDVGDTNDLLKQYLIEEFGERHKRRAAERESALRMNENSRKNAELFQANKESRQSQCSHTQPKGETDVRGQWLSNGKLFLTCQRCSKNWQWPETPPPPHLMPSPDDYGQPSGLPVG